MSQNTDIDRIIVATKNADKVREIGQIMSGFPIRIMTMKEAGFDPDIDEDGDSFEENALIKARSLWRLSGGLVLADDSGLEIDFLNKEPGIYSARYMGYDTSYHIKNADLLRRMSGVRPSKRTARFVCAVAAVFPDGTEETVTGVMEGMIGYEERGERGFGYDPIFVLPKYSATTAELPEEVKNMESHRGKAFRAIRDRIVKYLKGHVSDEKESAPKVRSTETGESRILIVSDTHGKHENFRKAVRQVRPIDLLIHAGDVEGHEDLIAEIAGCPVQIVSGNNDFFTDLPREKEFNVGRYKVFLTHGHYFYVAMGPERIIEEAASRSSDIVIFGHTHKPAVIRSQGIIAINPGSISYPRQDGRRPSFIMMELDRQGEAHFTVEYL